MKLNKTIAVWLISFIAISLALSSCGGLRISSINARDDQDLRISAQHERQNVRSHTSDVDDKNLDYTIKKQSFTIKSSGNSNTTSSGWVPGVFVNRYDNRQVKFVVKSGNTIIREYVIDGGKPPLFKPLPLGQYKVEQWEYTVKGPYLETSSDLKVTNDALSNWNGVDFHFIVSN